MNVHVKLTYEFDINIDTIRKYIKQNTIARYLDCTIRCYLLNECIEKALEELKNEQNI